MDKDVIIRVEGLGKRYTLGAASNERYVALRDVLAQGARRLLRTGRRAAEEGTSSVSTDFWALKDVSFEVGRGEVVGIIGRNGAGKSTLLKILSRITEPTTGRITLKGRVASLLEVGTGFHPELTGRENIYLNGAILGMHRAEIKAKFDEIVAFAEVEKFLDTPVKRYSSGMYVRLAFAVAAHLEPEILIVDEVLAVGDAEFQKKCLGKMGEVAQGGRTVLFVSHNMGTVASLCDRVVWLEKGRIRDLGLPHTQIMFYTSEAVTMTGAILDLTKIPRLTGTGNRIRLERLEWLSPPPLIFGSEAKVRVSVRAFSAMESVVIGLGFNTLNSQRLLTIESDRGLPPQTLAAGCERTYHLTISDLRLTPGRYDVDIGIRSGDRIIVDGLPKVATIEVIGGEDTPNYILQHENAGLRLTGSWEQVT